MLSLLLSEVKDDQLFLSMSCSIYPKTNHEHEFQGPLRYEFVRYLPVYAHFCNNNVNPKMINAVLLTDPGLLASNISSLL